MLTTAKTLVDHAAAHGYAVGAFNVTDIAMARGVVQAAQAQHSPVILQLSQKHAQNIVPLNLMAPVLLTLAEQASVPVAVHLDHGFDPAVCIQALHTGFSSVMYDGSAKPLAVNRLHTKRIVACAHALSASVEAELGPMQRDSVDTTVDYQALSATYTDPVEAREFVADTGVDMLAVAFGTVHGVYSQTPHLNWQRLAALHEAVAVPLVVHGGSGLSDDDYRHMIKGGIAKINYFSNMAYHVANRIRDQLNATVAQQPYVTAITEWEQAAVQAEVQARLQIFGSAGQA
ncbi:class II fructose-bisphosphate aldolase [Lacticaseibacillus jixiensis]|uniref:class II fructose-bisphosphate aldolase n=1 Tax=Lacticaseibacillus jixiensis TaxID=3231926 RepID=UPI0036F2EAB9